jgi:hypothetical protein
VCGFIVGKLIPLSSDPTSDFASDWENGQWNASDKYGKQMMSQSEVFICHQRFMASHESLMYSLYSGQPTTSWNKDSARQMQNVVYLVVRW